jgi:hypothetical protein
MVTGHSILHVFIDDRPGGVYGWAAYRKALDGAAGWYVPDNHQAGIYQKSGEEEALLV